MSQEMFDKLSEAVIEGETDDAEALAKEAPAERDSVVIDSVRIRQAEHLEAT